MRRKGVWGCSQMEQILSPVRLGGGGGGGGAGEG